MKRLQAYIQEARKKGYTNDEIYHALIDLGWEKKDIRDDLHIPVWHTATLAVIIVLALTTVIGGILTLSPSCSSESCFVERANNCQPASILQDVGGTIIKIDTNNCIITQKIQSFHPNEQQDVIDLFSNREMVCPYKEKFLPPELTKGLQGLQYCNGRLKESILHVQDLLKAV